VNNGMTNSKFILASASPRRKDLLASVGMIPAQILPADADETPQKNEPPHLYAKRVALLKAAHIAALHPNDIILSADTVVACGARILPKAEDAQTALQCLKLLSGKRHRVYTAVVVQKGDKKLCKTVMTVVQFARLSKTDMDAYVASNEWSGKAGGYAIQGSAQRFIIRINGSYSNVVGLPLKETCDLLGAVSPSVDGRAISPASCEGQQTRNGSKNK
jgi:septum formation protein